MMISRLIVLALCFGSVVLLSGVYAAQQGCDMNKINKESRKCTRAFLDTMIAQPSANCSDVFKNMTSCLHSVLLKKCYGADDLPVVLRPLINRLINAYTGAISTAESTLCGDTAVAVNLSSIPQEMKKFVPCKQELYIEGPLCSKAFIEKFKTNRTDTALCGLYSKAKECESKVIKKYCQKEMEDVVDPYNPFCKKEVKSNRAPYAIVLPHLMVLACMFVYKLNYPVLD